jgi:8-oxo-dGTP diphosphatase
MPSSKRLERLFTTGLEGCLPHVSVDCVVFGFHEDELKLLLLKWRNSSIWSLPGGYVGLRESLDAAARRVLRDRTSLRRMHLRQFHAFGGLNRHEGSSLRRFFRRLQIEPPTDTWPLHRVVSIGYYALVDYTRVRPKTDETSDACTWFPIADRPSLAFDHDDIVTHAMAAVRASLGAGTVGSKLLPERFTMPELQRLHEAVLGQKLDRRNFQKRMLERGNLQRLGECRTGGAHRAPHLYRFVS